VPANLTFPRQHAVLQDYANKTDINWLLGDDKLPNGTEIQDSWFGAGRCCLIYLCDVAQLLTASFGDNGRSYDVVYFNRSSAGAALAPSKFNSMFN
jgi:hypothetical protein